jgi:hypothetical protein
VRFLLIALAAVALAVPSTARAVTFSVKCKDLTAEQVKVTRISVTKQTGCTAGRKALKHWIQSQFNTKQAHLGYFCHWDTHGAHQRRGRCIAGKNGGIAFTVTERKPSR